MADKIKVWFDAEADFLEVRFSDAAGYEKETKPDAFEFPLDGGRDEFRIPQLRKCRQHDAALATARRSSLGDLRLQAFDDFGHGL